MTAPARTAVALATSLALGVAFGAHRLVDPDLPQQIAVGRAIASGDAPVGVSTYVFPFPAFSYVEDKWLTSVAVAAIDRALGAPGLMLWQIGWCAIVACSWYFLVLRSGARVGASAAAAALLCVAGAYRMEPRPDTVSHAMLAGVVLVVSGGLPWRSVRWLVPLAIGAWIQLHGYFVNGLLVVVASIVAGLAGDRRGAIGENGATDALRRGGWVLAASCVACLTHPQGWRAFVWPLEQLRALAAEPALRSALTEFVPTAELFQGMSWPTSAIVVAAPLVGIALALRRSGTPRGARGAALLGVFVGMIAFPPSAAQAWPYRVAIAFALAAWVEAPSAWREGRRLEGILLAGFTVLAIPMVRNLSLVPPIAAMLAVPAVQSAWDRYVPGRRVGQGVCAAIVLGVLWARLADRLPPGTYRAPGWTGWGWDTARFPAAATEFVEREATPGSLLNNFDTSGWLLRELHPRRAVFIADNTSMYPAAFLREYRERIMSGREDPEALHERHGIRTVILDHAAMETPGLVARLSGSPSWRLVFLDRVAAVWIRDPGEESPAVDLDRAQATLASQAGRPHGPFPGSARRLFPELNLGIFLRAAGRPDLALREADRMWDAGEEPEIATFAAASAEEAGVLDGQVARLERAIGRFGEGRSVGRWLARARFVRGVRRAEAGEPDGALDDLRRSWELAPGVPGTSLAMARVEAERGRETEAIEHLSRALAPGADPSLRRAAESDPHLAPLLHRVERR